MAHKGRHYPLAPRRDLHISGTPVQRLAKRYSPQILQLYHTVFGNVFVTPQPSNDVVFDFGTSSFEYSWDPIVNFYGTWEFYFKYELTFASTITRTTHRLTLNGVTQTRTQTGIQFSLYEPAASTLQWTSGIGFIVWVNSAMVGDQWRSSDNT